MSDESESDYDDMVRESAARVVRILCAWRAHDPNPPPDIEMDDIDDARALFSEALRRTDGYDLGDAYDKAIRTCLKESGLPERAASETEENSRG